MIKTIQKALAISVVLTTLIISVKPSFAEPPKDAKLITEHLDFLGFQSQTTSEYLEARSSKYLPIYMYQMDIGLNLNVAFPLNQNGIKNQDKLASLLNKINAEAVLIKLYFDNNDLVIEAVYTGEYNKKEFGAFMQTYLADYDFLYQFWDELEKYLDL